MSHIYPSLEDMKVGQMAQAQAQYEQQTSVQPAVTYPHPPGAYPPQQPPAYTPHPTPSASGSMYPSLQEYMGLQITPEMTAAMAVVPANPTQVAVRQSGSGSMQVAPVTGNNRGLARAEIKQGIREVVMCKDGTGKVGLRVRHVNNGLFVCLVQDNSPAALSGLRFGDQILQINGQTVAGWDTDKAHKELKKAAAERITMAVRDRPFERTITMQKDSNGYIGFVFKDGRIKSIVKDSSAARNGVLTDHQLTEVNGQNVIGLTDNRVGDIIDAGGRTVTITLVPCIIYDHIIKCMGGSLFKKMDHSIPEV
ncbi:syntenin-1-like isoform X2 [Haliotis rubra]|nr:syntenin-1-like isoform X2 [Haliotis rubra]